jgi:predicted nucleic acid-binding protein
LKKHMKNMRHIFIDANIFTYLLTGHPVHGRACQKLLEKVENGDLDAYISPLVIDEVSYVLMVQMAREKGGPADAKSIKQEMFARRKRPW